MRKQQNELLKDYIQGTMVPLKFSSCKADAIEGYETRPAPFIRVNNISAMVLDYLDRLVIISFIMHILCE